MFTKSNFKKSVVIITAIFSGSVFADVNIGDFNTGVIGNGTAVGNNNSLGGSTNGVVVGNGGSLSNSINGVVIGNGSVSDGDGVSVGGGTSTNGGIAIGSGSNATRSDEMNIGDRQITGVKAGVADTDAANVGQLVAKAGETLNSANIYVDNQATETLNNANIYTDNKATETINNANTYTDNKSSETLNSANSYTDNKSSETFNSANTYTDSKTAEIFNTTKTYMDGKSKETLNNTYDYVDSKVSSIVYDVNSYTDKTVNTAFETSLSDAKSYVDDKYNQLSDKVNKNFNKTNAGISGAMAMSGIPQKFGYEKSFGMAIGAYRGQSALAVGGDWNINHKTITRVNVSADTEGGVGVAAGFAFGIN
ncbi:YadA-like family protein [Yersinia pestis]|uniref:YadA-like family protein n=1 Tax=Yersinia pestis TaxID=632 RepID=UPI00067A0766|nr:YadA-like family protein [Yersinia pestis]AKS99486.1 coiled stalk of trimeric autotransporter adhesin family protein [Yersinia pestis 3067]